MKIEPFNFCTDHLWPKNTFMPFSYRAKPHMAFEEYFGHVSAYMLHPIPFMIFLSTPDYFKNFRSFLDNL